MADSGEESSDSSSVDWCEDFGSPSPSSSSEDSATENEPDTSSISRPSGSKRKNDSQPRSTGKATEKQQKRNKKQSASLNNDEIEELTSWIFSTQEAGQVEAEIRPQVAGSPRIKVFSERERFVKHMLCEEQKPNFQLLVAGFCRTFSTLASDCSKLPDKQNRKATFSAAWMKLLSNFRSGKSSQERLIAERFLVGQQFNIEVVHAVISLVHELVYTCVHSHIQGRKMSNTTLDTRTSRLCTESDETLYRYCGAALHRMTKLRRETLQQKKGRGKVSRERKVIMELELNLLQDLTMEDKSSLSLSLQNLDEGNLVFPRNELLPFLRHVDDNIREFTCDSNLKKFPTKFLEMCRSSVLNNEELEVDFRLLVASLSSAEVASNSKVVDGLFKALVSKLANTRINEFMNAKVERDLKKDGKVVDADEMLRPKLKSYTLSTKRK